MIDTKRGTYLRSLSLALLPPIRCPSSKFRIRLIANMSQRCRRTPENVLGGHKTFCECPGVAQDIDTTVDRRFHSNFCY